MADAFNAPWRKKHDRPGDHIVAPRIAYPAKLEELISLCKSHPAGQLLHAAGSHWALSTAAVSDHTFVETHDPGNVRPAMGATLYEVVPNSLSEQILDRMAAVPAPANPQDRDHRTSFVHVEAGKRVYQLYAELDQPAERDPQGLAAFLEQSRGTTAYHGSWGFRTLGGAGGQTVFGALTTGTHGGDFKEPPIADDVVAVHLVADGGTQYWIERPELPEGQPLTDDDKLHDAYDHLGELQIRRDDSLFRAVLVAAGRFGVVYSLVLRAVPQYILHEIRQLDWWHKVRDDIPKVHGPLYEPQPGHPMDQSFLQIAVSLAPTGNFTTNRVGITRRERERWLTGTAAPGRDWRVGGLLPTPDPLTGGPQFEFAGNSYPYDPDVTDPSKAIAGTFLERACANGDFLDGVIESAIQELTDFTENHTVAVGSGIAAVVAVGGAAALEVLLAALIAVIAVLAEFLAALRARGEGERMGQVLDELQGVLLSGGNTLGGVFAWQLIALKVFESEQGPREYRALSYAVMDSHDYHDQSCMVNVDSLEVFFDATDPMLLAYVDALLAFEARQEWLGKAAVGYASLRFTSQTTAFLGPSRWNRTCVIEVAVLKDVGGSQPLIDYAMALARDPNFSGILHWGQRNDCTADEIARRFGDPTDPATDFGQWRAALDDLTDHGRLNAFSSKFTRGTGLEP